MGRLSNYTFQNIDAHRMGSSRSGFVNGSNTRTDDVRLNQIKTFTKSVVLMYLHQWILCLTFVRGNIAKTYSVSAESVDSLYAIQGDSAIMPTSERMNNNSDTKL